MPRGTGIAKRGFGKALPRVGYAEGGDVESYEPENLKDEIELDELKEIKKPETKSISKKAKEVVKDFGKGVLKGAEASASIPYKAAKKIKESLEKMEDPEFRKKSGIGQPYLGPFRKELKKGGSAKPGLWANINRRKKLGISRPKSESTISKKAYANMKAGFPKKKK